MFGSGTITRRSSSVPLRHKVGSSDHVFQVIVVIANIINEEVSLVSSRIQVAVLLMEITVVGHIEDSSV